MYLKAGGLSFFSDRCIELLAKFGYEPEDFGSYDHVKERLSEARRKVADADAGKPGATIPTEREKQLGKPMDDPDHYESGHLGMNTCMQGKRGDPCSNFVSGHDDGMYPCMPHQGSATDPGSEHNRWTAAELDAGKGDPEAKVRGEYPKEKMDADADQRTKDLLKDRGEVKQPSGTDVTTGGGPAKSATSAVDPQKAAADAKARAAQKERMPEDSRVDGETADDCINNFRKGGESGMKKHISDPETIKKNRQAAGTAQERQEKADAAAAKQKEADAAAAELRKEQSALGGKRAAVTKAQDAAQGVPTKEQADKIDAAQQSADEKAAKVAELKAKHDDLQEKASAAQGVSTKMENANCRAIQGEAIRTGQPYPPPPADPVHPSDAGKYPKPWDKFPREGTQENSGQVDKE
jgi:hypothetical protein